MEVLTKKQALVLRLRVKEDKSTQEIAEVMGVTTRMVEKHIDSLKNILRAKSQAHMAYIAVKAGLVE